MSEPSGRAPATESAKGGPQSRERVLVILSELVSRDGASSLLLPPVIPGEEAFPDAWAPSKLGVQLLLRRLATYADIDVEIEIDDRRAGAPPTERKPATRAELVEVRGKQARFALGFIGTDDVVGTLAHEVGTLWAVLHRTEGVEPYRTAESPVLTVESDRDHVRGAVAAVYRGLGVLAANAAYQQYTSPGRFNGMYVPHEYDVITAGALPLSTMTYLVAVQAVLRGDDGPPEGLGQSQRDEVIGFMKTLAGDRRELCERIGIDPAAKPGTREAPVAFADHEDVTEDAPRKNAWRWQTNRGGIGFFAGTVLGIGVAMAASRGMLPITALGGAAIGHLAGRRVRTPRCSGCASVVTDGAKTCPHCGAVLRGDITSLNQRLEAEENLEAELKNELAGDAATDSTATL